MKPSRIVLLLVALLAGGLAAFLATRGDAPAPVTAQATAPVVVKNKVLVAKADIGVGQRLSPSVLDWQEWPQNDTADYITISAMPDAPTQMNGAVARFEFFKGDPIREQKLARSDQGFLSAVLTPGMRGVSISVAAASGAGGFIVPNDRVDVIQSSSAGGQQVSRTILSDVKVLAIGTRLGQIGTTGAPADATDPKSQIFANETIATLELTPPQGELVINATQQGRISLALRSVADFKKSASDGMQRTSDSQAIRVIRFGKPTDIQSGTAQSAAASIRIDPAALAAAPTVSVGVAPPAPVPLK
jgi:pilus assembly protein CpaB